MTLLPFSMTLKNHWKRNSTFHIYHLPASVLINSVFSLITTHMSLLLSKANLSVLHFPPFPMAYWGTLLQQILPIPSGIVNFSFSTVSFPTNKTSKEKNGEVERHRYLLINAEIHKTQRGKRWTPNNKHHMITLPTGKSWSLFKDRPLYKVPSPWKFLQGTIRALWSPC